MFTIVLETDFLLVHIDGALQNMTDGQFWIRTEMDKLVIRTTVYCRAISMTSEDMATSKLVRQLCFEHFISLKSWNKTQIHKTSMHQHF